MGLLDDLLSIGSEVASEVAKLPIIRKIAPHAARPIVQKLMLKCVIRIGTVMITNPQETSFEICVEGITITEAGPFDAMISFRNGLNIFWNGRSLGKIVDMREVIIKANKGASFNIPTTTFKVMDVNALAEFVKVLLNEKSFQWDVSADDLTVSALDIQVSGITLPRKKVTLKGFDGLRNGIKVDSFDLPANDPAGGITLAIQSTVTNPSQVGIKLSSITFNVFASEIEIACVSSSSVEFTPESKLSLPLTGRLIPQKAAKGLDAVSAIFNNFIQGEDSEVTVRGESADSGKVTWLNKGIQTLTVATSLPNQGKLNVIQSITLEQMALCFTKATACSLATSSNATTIKFTLPFGFPLNVTSLSQNITVSSNGKPFVELAISKAPSSTQGRTICLTFSDMPLTVFSHQHSFFDKFVAEASRGAGRDVVLSGVADAVTSTAVGVLLLSGIEFSVKSSIANLCTTRA